MGKILNDVVCAMTVLTLHSTDDDERCRDRGGIEKRDVNDILPNKDS